MPSDPELVEMHQELLCLLKMFHELCVENDIKYSLHGGTLIGAIREKGFIPWDNDADVSMTREEYEKLASVMDMGKAPKGVSFDGRHRVPRLILKRDGRPTTFLDIFIYDPITKNKYGVLIKIYGNMFLRSFIEDSVNLTAAKMRKKYSPWKYNLYSFFQKVGRLLPDGVPLRIFTAYNKHFLCGKKDQIFRSNDGFQQIEKWLLPAADMENLILTEFEGEMLMVHQRYHEILTLWHGDYMTPVKYADVETEAHDVMRGMLDDYVEKPERDISDGGVNEYTLIAVFISTAVFHSEGAAAG